MTRRMRRSVRSSPESSHRCSRLTGHVRSHRTGRSQRPINYCAENPRLAGSHRMSPVWQSDMSGRSLQSYIGLYHFDLTLNSNSSASGHSTEPESGHFHLVTHLGSKYRTRPILIPDMFGHFCLTTPRLDKIPDASGPSFGGVRSLCDQRD